MEAKFQAACAEKEIPCAVLLATDRSGKQCHLQCLFSDPAVLIYHVREIPICQSIWLMLSEGAALLQTHGPGLGDVDCIVYETHDSRGRHAVCGTRSAQAGRRCHNDIARIEASGRLDRV